MRGRLLAPVATAALVTALVSVLAGCVPTGDDGGAADASPSTPATVNVDGFTPAPTPTIPANGSDGQDTRETPEPVSTDAPVGVVIPSGDSITPELAGKAEVAAQRFVAAFVSKNVTGQAWEDGYLPYLTPYSQTAYQGTGQANVPGTRVTGTPALAEEGTNTVTAAVVTVPTDAGTYTVQVFAQPTGAWLVQRAYLPGTTP